MCLWLGEPLFHVLDRVFIKKRIFNDNQKFILSNYYFIVFVVLSIKMNLKIFKNFVFVALTLSSDLAVL